MDDHLIVIFQTEVELQCRFVLFGVAQLESVRRNEAEQRRRIREAEDAETDAAWAWNDADDADAFHEFMRRYEQTREASNQLRALDISGHTWFALQSILTAAANLSKLLWGTGHDPGAETRRAPLRESVGVGADSPLKSYKVRNHFEHIDEKIERRFHKPGRTLYMGRNMGPYYDARVRGLDEAHFGQWDPDSGVVTFWDHAISIPEIVAEVARIHPIVRAHVEGPFGRE